MATRKSPKPGKPVRGSTTGRPLNAAMDLLGRRWSLRILWELRNGALGARALRELCDSMSSIVLYDRLVELGGAGLIAKNISGAYTLTDLGEAIGPLGAWANEWASRTPDRGS